MTEASIVPRRALISVSDKRGIAEFAKRLVNAGVEIVSTGGTCEVLRNEGVQVLAVDEVTGNSEILDGRVKTLDPAIHGAILGRRGKDDSTLETRGIVPIDLVVVNLYPFEQTLKDKRSSDQDCIEMIDIGGPAMIRSAAKNWQYVAVVVDQGDYDSVAQAIEQEGITDGRRRQLAAKAFSLTADYDAAVANWFNQGVDFPERLFPRLRLHSRLRYGENPHQNAAAYKENNWAAEGIMASQQIQGKELSFNNLADADVAWNAVTALESPAVVIVKHQIPCGVGVAQTISQAYSYALESDPISAFGGVIACSYPLDLETAEQIIKRQFCEVIVAPGIEKQAAECVRQKPNLRVLITKSSSSLDKTYDWRRVMGGVLIQDRDIISPLGDHYKVVTKVTPSADQLRALDLSWRVVQVVRSNGIVISSQFQTLGIGSGQTSRVGAVRLASELAKQNHHSIFGAVLASDGFFPFRDNIDVASELGIRAIVQPGGSRRDEEVISAANEHGIAMVFAGERHFRH